MSQEPTGPQKKGGMHFSLRPPKRIERLSRLLAPYHWLVFRGLASLAASSPATDCCNFSVSTWWRLTALVRTSAPGCITPSARPCVAGFGFLVGPDGRGDHACRRQISVRAGCGGETARGAAAAATSLEPAASCVTGKRSNQLNLSPRKPTKNDFKRHLKRLRCLALLLHAVQEGP